MFELALSIARSSGFSRSISELRPECFALDSKSERLFVGEESGLVVGIDVKPGRHNNWLLGHALISPALKMSCTQDGRSLMVLDRAGLISWNIDSGSKDVRFPRWCRVDPLISCFAIYPDSQTAVFGRTADDHSELFEVNILNGDCRLVFDNIGERLSTLVISEDGMRVACVNASGEIKLLSRRTYQEPWQLFLIPGLSTGTTSVACFSPRSELLITSDPENHVLIAWDLDQKIRRHEFDWNPTVLLGCNYLNDTEIMSWSLYGVSLWNTQFRSPVREITK